MTSNTLISVMGENSCIICGSKYRGSKLKGLLECDSCHFMTADLAISDEELKAHYSEEYFHGKEYGNYVSDKKNIQRNFQKRLNTILKLCPGSKDKKLFEIGCAYGFFLELAEKHFDNAAGIDISSGGIKYARDRLGVEAFEGDFLEFNFREKKDVFCLWDTIEHLKQPDLFIKKISENINNDGLIAITTGDIDSLNARIRGMRWRQIHPPTHLHYFSKKTLSALLNKYGFVVVYAGYPGVFRSVDDMAYIILSLKNNKPGLYGALKRMGLLKWNIYFNTFDFLSIIGRKER